MRMTNPFGLLAPKVWVSSVADITPDYLRTHGIRGLILDLDETLVTAISHTAADRVRDWITDLRSEFQLYIVSNNNSGQRVKRVADDLDLPCLHQALKPRRKGFRRALAAMNLQPNEVAIVGDQLFTDVLGGNRLGAHPILVTPLSPETRAWRKAMRLVEGMFIHQYEHLKNLNAAEAVWTSQPESRP